MEPINWFKVHTMGKESTEEFSNALRNQLIKTLDSQEFYSVCAGNAQLIEDNFLNWWRQVPKGKCMGNTAKCGNLIVTF